MYVYNLAQHVKNILSDNAITDFRVETIALPINPQDNFILVRENGSLAGQLGLHFSTLSFTVAGYSKSNRRRLETVINTLYTALIDKYQVDLPQPSGLVIPAAHTQYVRRYNRPTFTTSQDWMIYIFSVEVLLSEN